MADGNSNVAQIWIPIIVAVIGVVGTLGGVYLQHQLDKTKETAATADSQMAEKLQDEEKIVAELEKHVRALEEEIAHRGTPSVALPRWPILPRPPMADVTKTWSDAFGKNLVKRSPAAFVTPHQ